VETDAVLTTVWEINKYLNIYSDTGAIVVGKNFEIDGFSNKPFRVVTHIHSDHIIGLEDSIKYSRGIIATPATHDLLIALNYIGNHKRLSLYKTKRMDLDYYERREINDETIVLYPTTHILGSAQVMVETDGVKIGYTSDFKLGDNTVIMKDLDILVIEATYGHPGIRRRFKHEVPELLVDLVLDGFRKYGRVVLYGYYGKLQEAMLILRERGVDEPFIMNEKVYAFTRVAEKYGWRINNYYQAGTREAREIMMSNRFVLFEHMNRVKYRRLNGVALNIVLTGHEYREPIRRIDEHTWITALSDHADFDELMSYVEASQPRIVVVDGYREGYPKEFAEELRKRGWRAYVLPEENA